MPSLHVCYWHAAHAMNALAIKLHNAIIVPAWVQLAIRQNLLMYSAYADVKMLQINSL
jgi:hypothetical protein